ncbi:hypothetical protein PY650_36550, partial [Rhizobium calliandrae]
LSATANWLVNTIAASARCAHFDQLRDFGADDPLLSAWTRWQAARREQNRLCRRQQRLENELLRAVGKFPQVEIRLKDEPQPVFARTPEEIDHLLSDIGMEEVRERAKIELVRIRTAWDEADAKIGYSVACAAESKAAARVEDLGETMWGMAALTIPGVIAKLHSLIEMDAPGASSEEKPWPELRAILADLLESQRCSQ